MLTVLVACIACVFAGFFVGYQVCLRSMGNEKHESFWTGFDCGRKDVKADIPAHIDIHRELWEAEKV